MEDAAVRNRTRLTIDAAVAAADAIVAAVGRPDQGDRVVAPDLRDLRGQEDLRDREGLRDLRDRRGLRGQGDSRDLRVW